MLARAAKIMGPDAARAGLIEGTIDDAPIGPFDGATCLLTLHFLDRAERIRTAAEIRRRLKPGADCVAAHGSFPQEAGARDRWLDRYAAYAIASGGHPEQVRSEERRVGKECVNTCRSRWDSFPKKKNLNTKH